MTNDIAIPPALTPEQWAKREYANTWDAAVFDFTQDIPGAPRRRLKLTSHDAHPAHPTFLEGVECHALMALANAAISDNDTDPRKITRADVAALRDVLGTSRDDEPDYNGELASLDIARAVCAKLAAILPPE